MTKETLKQFREKLIQGDMQKIADDAGFSRSYVSQYFAGEVNPTTTNERILKAAMRLLRDRDELEANAKKLAI